MYPYIGQTRTFTFVLNSSFRFASIGTKYLFLEDFQRSQGEDRGDGGPEELKSGSERITATTTILFSILSGAWLVFLKNVMINVS